MKTSHDTFPAFLQEQYPQLRTFDIEKARLWYADTLISRQLLEQRKQWGFHEGFGVFSDMDGTLNVKGKEPSAQRLANASALCHFPLIAITGATNEEIYRRSMEEQSPWMHVIVGHGGLKIQAAKEVRDGRYVYEEDPFFQSLVSQHSNWDRTLLLQQLGTFISEMQTSRPEFQLCFQKQADHDFVEGKTTKHFEPHKVGLYFMAETLELRQEMIDLVEERFPGVIKVVCSEINHNAVVGREEKYNLDFTVMEKLGAVMYLQRVLGIGTGLIAGDSGNDFRQIVHSLGLKGVIVGGYKPELIRMINDLSPNDRKHGFREIVPNLTPNKQIYVENGDRVGPESIEHALKACSRATAQLSLSEEERKYFSHVYQTLAV